MKTTVQNTDEKKKRAQEALQAEFLRLSALLENLIAATHDCEQCAPERTEPDSIPSRPIADSLAPGPLDIIAERFGLSDFERDIIALCAGAESDPRIAGLCSCLFQDADARFITVNLALSVLPDPDLAAFSPDGTLRRLRLIQASGEEPLIRRKLGISERVLFYLYGIECEEVAFGGIVQEASIPESLPPSHHTILTRIEGYRDSGNENFFIQLHGPDRAGALRIAARAAHEAGARPLIVNARSAASDPQDQEGLARLWERETRLEGRVLLLVIEPEEEQKIANNALRFLASIDAPRFLISPRARGQEGLLALEVPRPSPAEQTALWQGALGPVFAALNGETARLAMDFDFSTEDIESVSRSALSAPGAKSNPASLLRRECLRQARPALQGLARVIEPRANWEDLTLPEAQLETLREISLQVRRRRRVYEDWGFSARSSRGLGISALFAGPSGTGKTLAAEILAGELGLDLYHIDLSAVVSKYIGETEKNLNRVFEAAERGGGVLLFDEADALFGKRSEIKDSHDRYANIEVSYLLQRMESYRGLAVLTTNLKNGLDAAFLRRLRFVVQFPFPDRESRFQIWRRVFPEQTPLNGIDPEALSRLNLAGGNIKNIALCAAFLAAESDEAVSMKHLKQAARGEYIKLEKTMSGEEFSGFP